MILRRYARSCHASAAIEFAVVAPILILLAGACVEFGMLFQVYNAVDRLAAQYAIAWSDCSDVPAGTCTSEIQLIAAANVRANIAPQLDASSTTLRAFQISMVGTNPAVVSAYPAGATPSGSEVAAAQSTFKNGQSAVIVTVSYSHSLHYFGALMSPLLGPTLNPSYTVTQLKN